MSRGQDLRDSSGSTTGAGPPGEQWGRGAYNVLQLPCALLGGLTAQTLTQPTFSKQAAQKVSVKETMD